MEFYKVGEIVTFPDGDKAEIVDNTTGRYRCRDCCVYGAAYNTLVCMEAYKCNPVFRTDDKRIIYKKL